MDAQLLGTAEAARLLGISKRAVCDRRNRGQFPEPIAELACGPVWSRSQLVEYARKRAARFEERPGVEALAAEADWLTVADAARTIGASEAQLHSLIRFGGGYGPGLKRAHATGDVTHVHRSTLGVYARAIGAEPIETRRAA